VDDDTINREHFAHQLLAAVTMYSNKRFQITKQDFGECWGNNCADRLSSQNGHFCDKCFIKGQLLTNMQKLKIFNDESLAVKTQVDLFALIAIVA
jgi:hypothetical protein